MFRIFHENTYIYKCINKQVSVEYATMELKSSIVIEKWKLHVKYTSFPRAIAMKVTAFIIELPNYDFIGFKCIVWKEDRKAMKNAHLDPSISGVSHLKRSRAESHLIFIREVLTHFMTIGYSSLKLRIWKPKMTKNHLPRF